MKKNYRVQMMNSKSYSNYMEGSYDYDIKSIIVKAENSDEALNIAKSLYPNYVIHSYSAKEINYPDAEMKMLDELHSFDVKIEELENKLAELKAKKEEYKKMMEG